MSRLPIHAFRSQILDTIKSNQVTILVGETGSGKTTQLPQFLLEAGYGRSGRIGVTQPRRVAAISVARYVASEVGCEVGQLVGYQIRLDDSTTAGTAVKFMTDGILLAEANNDPFFHEYEVLVIDEAHERSLNIDCVLGIIKRALSKRPDLRIVVMSASINHGKFSAFFGNAPVFFVHGSTYQVEVNYLTASEIDSAKQMFSAGPYCIEELAAYQVGKICQQRLPGDILVFMPGKREIDKTINLIDTLGLDVELIAVHGDMSPEDQQVMFRASRRRKVVVATNIAETSLTIDGIVHVIDSGVIRQTDFDPRTGIGSLRVVEHSKAGLEQRRGRAGRTQPGYCWRLFLEEEYNTTRILYRNFSFERPDHTTPEIQRSNLAGVVLRMIGIGVTDVLSFSFVDQPDRSAIKHAYETLHAIGALDDKDLLTEMGRQLTRLPVEPVIGRMILSGIAYGCVAEICTIAASFSAREIFLWPREEIQQARARRAKGLLTDSRGDFFTLLNVLDLYTKQDPSIARQWASSYYLNLRSLDEILKVRQQIEDLLGWSGIPISSVGYSKPLDKPTPMQKAQAEAIGKAVASGLLQNLLKYWSRHQYRRVLASKDISEDEVYLHPASVLFGADPELVVARSIVQVDNDRGTRVYASGCLDVTVAQIQEVAPHLVTTKEVTGSLYSYSSRRYLVTYIGGMEVKREEIPYLLSSISQPVQRESDNVAQWVTRMQGRVDSLLVDLRRYSFGSNAEETLSQVQHQLGIWYTQLMSGETSEVSQEALEAVNATIASLKAARDQVVYQQQRQEEEARQQQRLERLAVLEGLRGRIGEMTSDESWRDILRQRDTSVASLLFQLESVNRHLGYGWSSSEVSELLSRLTDQIQSLEAARAQWEADQKEEARKREEDLRYQAEIESLQQAQYPGFGQYRFAMDKDGIPASYKNEDGYTIEFDFDASSVWPEEGSSYWGFVNQTIGRVRRVGLLLEVRTVSASRQLSLVGARP